MRFDGKKLRFFRVSAQTLETHKDHILPTSVKVLLAIVGSTFFIDQLSSFYDAHWNIAEFSFGDPIYLGMTVMWVCIVIWICHDIIRRKKHILSTIKVITIIVSAFMAFEFIENDVNLITLISFQFLEVVFWCIAFLIAKFIVEDEWFCE